MIKFNFLVFVVLFIFFSFSYAKANFSVVHGKNHEGLAQVKIVNETKAALACYVAIDGYKIKFSLPAYSSSKWYKAVDRSFNYRNFSTWCDYLELHPEYKAKH